MLFYLIDRGFVTQIAGNPFEVAESIELFWVEAPENSAQVGDKYIDGKFEPRYSLPERQDKRINELMNVFVSHLDDGITVNDKTFFSDAQSRELMGQALSSEDRGIPVFPTIWFLKDQAPAEISYEEVKQASALLVEKVKGCYYNREVLRAAIMGSQDPESVDLQLGWPK